MISKKNLSENLLDQGGLDLLEAMHIFSDLYLTHLLAEEILGESRHFAELGESPWMTAILSLKHYSFFKRLMQIH
ncbi:MAG: hypothetical protein WA584_02285 [Pyrinomonadaceae bacterium]